MLMKKLVKKSGTVDLQKEGDQIICIFYLWLSGHQKNLVKLIKTLAKFMDKKKVIAFKKQR